MSRTFWALVICVAGCARTREVRILPEDVEWSDLCDLYDGDVDVLVKGRSFDPCADPRSTFVFEIGQGSGPVADIRVLVDGHATGLYQDPTVSYPFDFAPLGLELLLMTETGACADGVDSDLDGLVDGADADCELEPPCTDCNDVTFEVTLLVEGSAGLYSVDYEWYLDGDLVTSTDVPHLSVTLPDGEHRVTLQEDDGFFEPVRKTFTARPGLVVPLEAFVVDACSNGADDDEDGLEDCAEPVCAATPLCSPVEICDNEDDDDGDGYEDCGDEDCASDPACAPETVCDDGADDDGDGYVDCSDGDCSADPACQDPRCDPAVVISGVYVEGGSAANAWAEDFVELRNRRDAAVDLTGTWLHVRSTDARWDTIDLAGVVVPARAHVLVALATPGQYTGVALAADVVQAAGVTELADLGGAVILSSSSATPADGTCPTTDVLDAVGIYDPSSCGEGGWISGSTDASQMFRRVDSCVDTDVNSADFAVVAVGSPLGTSTVGASCTCP